MAIRSIRSRAFIRALAQPELVMLLSTALVVVGHRIDCGERSLDDGSPVHAAKSAA
ncbi:hypothetical protein OG976_14940 [Mycobacterium sp. NBC_00419]|uniref:hypothetical protein n=1 Tax=Mycobacterium sp. NBC_00419 TaxID=2975989 RepID=UPI002E24055A